MFEITAGLLALRLRVRVTYRSDIRNSEIQLYILCREYAENELQRQ